MITFLFVFITLIFFNLLSPSGVNTPELPDNWFWRVGFVARRFYSLKRFQTALLENGSLRYKKKEKNEEMESDPKFDA